MSTTTNTPIEFWNEKLISEYSDGKKELEKRSRYLLSKNTDQFGDINFTNPADEEEYRIVSEMISDMKYAIEWMRKGRRPGNLRGIDRRSAYERTSLLDMDLFPQIDMKPKQVYLSDSQREKLLDVLIILSHRERQCYLLHMAQGMSLAEIAEEIGLKKRTVQQYVDRAKEKVRVKVSYLK
ncbi:sigma-70 family RNA polymerase sigma factor [Jeotgalibacillus campisalis]|uniref:HTH luxR-type domain-containing protein n=1 Tax=Jeotgalibacillus campisalis TaxID=220754 RepID=A0A0C2VQ82_9BACL|nr:sigma-70 family RNA polymerase sigma factor [Jeotgalibacillus campisalis]KIL46173.1 hypothetical protein KR50_28490 [Jeotgalibacillus campisalis]